MARYRCGSCGVFKTLLTLEKHLRVMHGVQVNLTKSATHPRYFCRNCNLQFRRLIDLFMHLSKAHRIEIRYQRGISNRRVHTLNVKSRKPHFVVVE